MRVVLLAPQWDRSCATCLKYLPREDGSFVVDKVTGRPTPRGKVRELTPCHKCAKVPERAKAMYAHEPEKLRAAAVELTDQNRQAYQFYRECRAVGAFPDDPIVTWVATIVREAEDERDRLPVDRLADALAGLVAVLPYLIRR